MLLTFLEWLRETAFSTALREAIYMWAVVNGIHVLGMGMFLGLLLFWDLRLLNRGVRHASLSETWNRLSPWIALGFAVMAISGILLFISDPVRFWGNLFFRIKLVALIVAGLNALAFHFFYGRDLERSGWDTGPTPTSARVAGALSLGLWVVVVVTGRLIAYAWFPSLV